MTGDEFSDDPPWYLDDDLDTCYETEGVHDELLLGLKGAKREYDRLLGRGDHRKNVADWVKGWVNAALNLDAPSFSSDLGGQYWGILGQPPMSREDWEATQQVALDALTKAGAPDNVLKAVGEAEYIDQKDKPKEVMINGAIFELAHIRLLDLPKEADRLLELVPYARQLQLESDLANLVKRVARLHVLGMEKEVAIVARAAVEVAVKRAVTDKEAIASMVKKSEKYPQLIDFLRGAKHKGILSKYGFDSAEMIRLRGNRAVHNPAEGLDSSVRSLEVVHRLMWCLQEIQMGLNQENGAE